MMTVTATDRETQRLEELYSTMLEIRLFEEQLLRLYRSAGLTGTTHTSIGQEAIAAGVLAHLQAGDGILSNHRGHGHYLASGGDARALLDEIRGDRNGACGGVGGSQHLHFRRFYSNGILGGTVAVAGGLAWADKIRGSGRIAVCFLGDGALGEGVVYEALNLAALWSLPVLYVVENNGYAQSTPQHLNLAGSIRARFAAFGIGTVNVDGNDIVAVDAAASTAFAAVRAGRPFCIVADTYRLEAHSKGDDVRDPDEIEVARRREPLVRAAALFSPARVRALRADVERKLVPAFAVTDLPVIDPPTAVLAPDRPPAAPGAPYPWREGRTETMLAELQRALGTLMQEHTDVHVLGEDLLDPYGGAFKVTNGLSTRFPERVWTTPVSEAAIVGAANGLALSGLRPVVEIMFGDFSTLIVDQLVNHAAKFTRMYGGDVSCPVIVRTPMGGRRGYGPTHSQSLEKIFLGVPGLTVVAADPVHDPALIWQRMYELAAPCLYVENKALYGTPLPLIESAQLGSFRLTAGRGFFPTTQLSLGDSADAVLICYGEMTMHAIAAARQLFEEHEWIVDVVVPSCLAPLDLDDLVAAMGSARAIVVVEEGTRRNGFGAEVIAALSDRGALGTRTARRIAMPDTIVPNNGRLERDVLPGTKHIVEFVRTLL